MSANRCTDKNRTLQTRWPPKLQNELLEAAWIQQLAFPGRRGSLGFKMGFAMPRQSLKISLDWRRLPSIMANGKRRPFGTRRLSLQPFIAMQAERRESSGCATRLHNRSPGRASRRVRAEAPPRARELYETCSQKRTSQSAPRGHRNHSVVHLGARGRNKTRLAIGHDLCRSPVQGDVRLQPDVRL